MKDVAMENSTISKDKLMRRTLRDFEFIARQIVHFRDKPIAHYRKRPADAEYTVPHPSGGLLVCGEEAEKKFDRVVEAIRALEPRLRGTISRHEIKNLLKQAYSDTFSHQEISIDSANNVVRKVAESSLGRLKSQIHHFPCVLFKNEAPESFSVGPVVFTRRALFFRQLKKHLAHSVEIATEEHIAHVDRHVARGFDKSRLHTSEQSRKHVRTYLAGAIKYYRPYHWIASVKVVGFEPGLSEDRAVQIIELALNILRIMIGAKRTQYIRMALSQGVPLRSAHLWTDERNAFHGTFKTSFGEHGPTGWYKLLTGKASMYVDLLGSSLNILTQFEPPTHIHQRLLDSIRWFGDAATDNTPGSKVVKYVSAIERLLFGARQADRAHNFAQRIQVLFREFNCPIEDAYEIATAIYTARSRAVHGAISPQLEDCQSTIYQAESVASLCIMCCASYYPKLILICQNTPQGLEKATKRIVEEGIDWIRADTPIEN